MKNSNNEIELLYTSKHAYIRDYELVIGCVLGGRDSIAKCCLDSIGQYLSSEPRVLIFLLVTHPVNPKLIALALKYKGLISNIIIARKNFHISCCPSGFDHDYDIIIKNSPFSSYFLCIHDDTIFTKYFDYQGFYQEILKYDLCGYLDHNKNLGNYKNILINGNSLSELRIGTWFMAVKRPIDYNIGFGEFLFKQDLCRLIGKTKIIINDEIVWLNGGCILNLKYQLEDKRIKLFKHKNKIAEHIGSATWDIVKSGLTRYNYFNNYKEREYIIKSFQRFPKVDKIRLLEKLEKYIKKLELHNVSDNVINHVTVSLMRKKINSPTKHLNVKINPQIDTLFIRMFDPLIGYLNPEQFERLLKKISKYKKIALHIDFTKCEKNDMYIIECLEILIDKLPNSIVNIYLSHVVINKKLYRFLKKECQFIINILIRFENNLILHYSFLKDVLITLQDRLNLYVNNIKDRQRILKFFSFLKVKIEFSDFFSMKSNINSREHLFIYGCQKNMHTTTIFIGPNGNFYLCPNDVNYEHVKGSIDTVKLPEYVHTEQYLTYYYRIETGGPDKLPCYNCIYSRKYKKRGY